MGGEEEWDDFLDEKDAHPQNAKNNTDPTCLDDEGGTPVGNGSDLATTEQPTHKGRGRN
ncbi:hypothetical protein YTPLAS72_27180 [Nitrospira sp.]|nr:hypothetical protein YTPLAS72_27180 [Nitrospira sp.]